VLTQSDYHAVLALEILLLKIPAIGKRISLFCPVVCFEEEKFYDQK
jgi:hypothetical protein